MRISSAIGARRSATRWMSGRPRKSLSALFSPMRVDPPPDWITTLNMAGLYCRDFAALRAGMDARNRSASRLESSEGSNFGPGRKCYNPPWRLDAWTLCKEGRLGDHRPGDHWSRGVFVFGSLEFQCAAA